MAESEIARLLELIEEEYQAGCTGLTGLAMGMSHHAFISARMENMGKYHAELMRIVGEDQATELMARHLNQSEA